MSSESFRVGDLDRNWKTVIVNVIVLTKTGKDLRLEVMKVWSEIVASKERGTL